MKQLINIKPREHQSILLKQLPVATNKEILIQLVTGAGKTLLFKLYANTLSTKRFLFVTPTILLAEQTQNKCNQIGFLQGAKSRGLDNRIVVATIQTLLIRIRQKKLLLDGFDEIWIDEAHLEKTAVNNLVKQTTNKQLVKYLTATPFTNSGKELPHLAKAKKYGEEFNFDYMVEKGYLTPIMIIDGAVVDIPSDMSFNADGEISDEDALTLIKNSNIDIVPFLTAIKKDAKTIIICRNINHAEDMKQLVELETNQKVEVIHSELGSKQKREIMKGFRDGTIDTLIGVRMLDAGIDIPEIDHMVLATIMSSLPTFIQRIGRGVRTSPSTNKTHLTLIDPYGNTKRLQHPFDKIIVSKSRYVCPKCGEREGILFRTTNKLTVKVYTFKCLKCDYKWESIVNKKIIKPKEKGIERQKKEIKVELQEYRYESKDRLLKDVKYMAYSLLDKELFKSLITPLIAHQQNLTMEQLQFLHKAITERNNKLVSVIAYKLSQY